MHLAKMLFGYMDAASQTTLWSMILPQALFLLNKAPFEISNHPDPATGTFFSGPKGAV